MNIQLALFSVRVGVDFPKLSKENCVSQLNYGTLSFSSLTAFLPSNLQRPHSFCLFPCFQWEREREREDTTTWSIRERLQDAILHFRSKFIISSDRRWNKEKRLLTNATLYALCFFARVTITKWIVNIWKGNRIVLMLNMVQMTTHWM